MVILDFLRILKRQKFRILVFLCASLIVTMVALWVKEPVYEASSVILVKPGREISLPPPETMSESTQLFSLTYETLRAEEEILASRYVAEEVVREIGVDRFSKRVFEVIPYIVSKIVGMVSKSESTPKPAPENPGEGGLDEIGTVDTQRFERALMSLQGNIGVELLSRSEALKVTYRHEDPAFAKEVLEVLLQKYWTRHTDVHQGLSSNDFFANQKNAFNEELQLMEEKLLKLKNDNKLYSGESQKDELVTQLIETQVDLEDARNAEQEKKAKIERIENQIAEHGRVTDLLTQEDTNDVASKLDDELVDLRVDRQRLLGQYAPTSRQVAVLDTQIEQVKELLLAEHLRVLQTNQNDLKKIQRQVSWLETQMNKYTERLDKINQLETEISNARREMTKVEDKYLTYEEKFEETRIREEFDRARLTNIRMLEPPTVMFTVPSGFGNPLIFAVSFFFSALASIGLGLIFERLDHSVKDPRDMEQYLNLRVLGSVPNDRQLAKV